VGRQRGHTEIYRGGEYDIHMHPKVRIEVLVNDPNRRDELILLMSEYVRTGRVGDGKIFVFRGLVSEAMDRAAPSS
jgi:nitrogen regulatory protein PII